MQNVRWRARIRRERRPSDKSAKESTLRSVTFGMEIRADSGSREAGQRRRPKTFKTQHHAKMKPSASFPFAQGGIGASPAMPTLASLFASCVLGGATAVVNSFLGNFSHGSISFACQTLIACALDPSCHSRQYFFCSRTTSPPRRISRLVHAFEREKKWALYDGAVDAARALHRQLDGAFLSSHSSTSG